jgi:fructose-1,6-bisphosphatase/inositol monophosphatase family enzyme
MLVSMALPASLLDSVQVLLAQAGDELILPRFRQLAAGDIEEKSPGEVVTVVDRLVEDRLGMALRALAPASRVVGEEACAADPGLLEQLDSGQVWVLDPLDGTRNFIEGRSDFGILLSLLHDGECVAGWMRLPLQQCTFFTARGAGAWRNGERLFTRPGTGPQRRGILKTRFLPPGLRERVEEAAAGALAAVQPGANCTAVDYPAIVQGASDFALYWRTLPWDHLAGVLFLQEAGGHAARLDGTAYRAADPRTGLLAAAGLETWHWARAALRL